VRKDFMKFPAWRGPAAGGSSKLTFPPTAA
jgi:hypothetical protein